MPRDGNRLRAFRKLRQLSSIPIAAQHCGLIVKHPVASYSCNPAVYHHTKRIVDVHFVEPLRLVGENTVDEELAADNNNVKIFILLAERNTGLSSTFQ